MSRKTSDLRSRMFFEDPRNGNEIKDFDRFGIVSCML